MKKNFLSIYAKSFNWAGFFLPKKIYQKCSSLYDFCRTIDDIADQELRLEIKIQKFKEFKDKFVNKDFNNLIIKNMYALINETGISKKIVYDLFDGVESDLKEEVIIKYLIGRESAWNIKWVFLFITLVLKKFMKMLNTTQLNLAINIKSI